MTCIHVIRSEGVNKMSKKIYYNTLCLPLILPNAIIYHFLNLDRFILIYNFTFEKKNR